MPIPISGQVGPAVLGDGTSGAPLRQMRTGELAVSEVHGRFYEQAYRGNIFVGGMTLTAINNATFTTATTGATATPIIGLYNPQSNSSNLVVLQAGMGVTMTALQATGGGPYAWMVGTAQNALTLGTTPRNRKSLIQAGSNAKDMSGIALTGLSGAISVAWGSALGGGSASNAAFLATAVAMQTQMIGSVENFDGSLIIPPGGVIALMATTTPVAHSVASYILWEEVPV